MPLNFIKPYEEDKQYIFVSYSHSDISIVYDVMEKLDAAGFRMWYDKGIPLTKDYADYIAQRIENCTIMMIFHSAKFSESDFCQNEIHHACDLRKPILQIFLQQTQLPPGLQLRLNRYQSINFYDFVNNNLNDFYEKIFSTELLQTCRENNYTENMRILGLDYFRAYKGEADPIKKAELRKKAIYYLEKVLNSNWVFKTFVKKEFESLMQGELYEINAQTVDRVYQHALNYLEDSLNTSNLVEKHIKFEEAKWILQKISVSDFSLKKAAKEKLNSIKANEDIRKNTFQELISRPQKYRRKDV